MSLLLQKAGPQVVAVGGGAFSPPDIAGLVLWNEAREEAYNDGDPAGTVTGLGGMPNFTQGTGAAKPTYRVTGGKPEYDFDGVDDIVVCASSVSLKHVFLSAKADEATFGNFRGLVTGPVGVGADIVLIGESGSTRFFDVASTTYHKDGTDYSAGDLQAPMAAWGVVSFSRATAWSLIPQLGRDRDQAGRIWDGRVRAIIAYDSVLSTTDRQSVETYLAAF